MSRLIALFSFLVMFGSIFLPSAFGGTQLAVIGLGFMLLAVFLEVRKTNKVK